MILQKRGHLVNYKGCKIAVCLNRFFRRCEQKELPETNQLLQELIIILDSFYEHCKISNHTNSVSLTRRLLVKCGWNAIRVLIFYGKPVSIAKSDAFKVLGESDCDIDCTVVFSKWIMLSYLINIVLNSVRNTDPGIRCFT